jgi:hypothetical protein
MATPSPPSHSAQGGGEDEADRRADGPQGEAVEGLPLLGAEDEEDRQRDPEAVLAHPQQPVGGDPGGEGGAEAQGVAEAGRAQAEVGAIASLDPQEKQSVFGHVHRGTVRQVLLAVTGAGIVLTGDTVVIGVETIGIVPWPTVLEEEDLRGALAGEIRTVLVARDRR